MKVLTAASITTTSLALATIGTALSAAGAETKTRQAALAMISIELFAIATSSVTAALNMNNNEKNLEKYYRKFLDHSLLAIPAFTLATAASVISSLTEGGSEGIKKTFSRSIGNSPIFRLIIGK